MKQAAAAANANVNVLDDLDDIMSPKKEDSVKMGSPV